PAAVRVLRWISQNRTDLRVLTPPGNRRRTRRRADRAGHRGADGWRCSLRRGLADGGDVGQAGDGQDRGEQRAGDQRQARSEREQDVDAGTVEVLHAGQVHDEPLAVPGGLAERVAEPVRVAHVDLADRGHHRGPVRIATGWRGLARWPWLILRYKSTVVPDGPGSMV